MRIYILGNGAMGSAMAYGLRDKFEVILVGRSKDSLAKFSEFKTEIYGSSYDISDKNIILAFKPYALKDMTSILKGRANLCISVLAMTNLADIKGVLSKAYCVCLPNIAAKYKASTTAYYTDSSDELITDILNSFGKAVRVENESELRVAGALAGCVPAYLAVVAEALANGGVKEGLKKEISLNLVNSVFNSTAKLLKNYHPALLKELVCSPKGTTIKGVYELEKSSVRGAFMDALSASVKGNI